MKIFTRILLVTALLAQQTALFATTAKMEAAKATVAVIAEQTDTEGMWAAFDLKKAENLFSFKSVFHCSKPGVNDLQVTENLKMGGSSVKDNRQTPTLSVFPNPSRGMVKISLSQAGDEVYKIRISNTIGKVVRTIEPAD